MRYRRPFGPRPYVARRRLLWGPRRRFFYGRRRFFLGGIVLLPLFACLAFMILLRLF